MNERSFIVNTYSCSPPLSSVVPHIRNALEAPRAVGEARYPESLPGGRQRSPPTLLLLAGKSPWLFKISYRPLLRRDATQPAQVARTSRGRRKDPESVAP